MVGYEILWEPRGTVKRFYGHVTDAQLMQSVIDIEGDHRFDTLRYVINDFLEVASFDVSAANVRIIAAIDAAAALTNPNIKVAIVATDAQVHALAEVYASAPTKPYPTAVFATTAAARNWV